MQPETQKIHAAFFGACSAIWRIACQVFLLLAALYIISLVSKQMPPTYISPTYEDGSTSIPAVVRQYGWPLLCCSETYWLQPQGPGKGGYNTTSIYFGSLIVNIAIIYVILRFAVFVLRRIARFGISRYDLQGHVDRYWPYIKGSILCGVGLLILYYLILILVIDKSAPIHSGVPIPLTQVGI